MKTANNIVFVYCLTLLSLEVMLYDCLNFKLEWTLSTVHYLYCKSVCVCHWRPERVAATKKLSSSWAGAGHRGQASSSQ